MTTALRLADIPVPDCLLVAHKELSPMQRAEARKYVREAYETGAPLRAIAGRTQRSFTFIHGIAHEAGLTMRPPGRRSPTTPRTTETS